MTKEKGSIIFDHDATIKGIFADRAEKRGGQDVAPAIKQFVNAVPNGRALLKQFAESYSDFLSRRRPDHQTPAAAYLSGFTGSHIKYAREINLAAMNAGLEELGQKTLNAVSAHIDTLHIQTLAPGKPSPARPKVKSRSTQAGLKPAG